MHNDRNICEYFHGIVNFDISCRDGLSNIVNNDPYGHLSIQFVKYKVDVFH